MRKLLSWSLTVLISFVVFRKIFRRQLVGEIWADNEDMSAQCAHHFGAIGIAEDNGVLDEEKLRWHLESIEWYATLTTDPIWLPATLYDQEIRLSYGNFWLDWARKRLDELGKDKIVNLHLIAS